MNKAEQIFRPDTNNFDGTAPFNQIYPVVFEHITEAVAVLKENNIVVCNPAFNILYGFKTNQELLNTSFLNLIPFNHQASFDERLRLALLERECPTTLQTIGIKKDSTLFAAELKISPYQVPEENFAIVTVKDITEKKQIQDQINKLSRVVDQSSSMIVITDPEGRIEYTNPKFTEVTGYFFEEVYGQKINFLKSGHTSLDEYKELWQRISEGKDWRGEFKNKKKNGDYYWASAVITPIKNENGETTHILAIKDDVTSRKEMELELKRALDSAEEASKLKSNLLSNMSHELRTPLTGIIGFSSLIRDELTDNDHIEIVDKILKSSKRLLITLNSILNLSEIESGTFPISITEFNLASYTKYFLTNYDKIATEKNLEFDIETLDPDINALADENLYKQVLIHIVDNALKFTNSGGVKVQITSSEDNQHNIKAVVKVIDTGIGIASEDQNKIFREFRQVSEGIRRNFEGSGLGLSVAKKMVTLMKGDIIVKSEPIKGSIFSIVLLGNKKIKGMSNFTVTHKPQASSVQLSTEQPPVKEKRKDSPLILNIEDNQLNSELVTLFLRQICNVDQAHNYDQAIGKIHQNKYSAVLIDINLGNGPSGIDIAKEIRNMPGYKQTPLIAITGYALLRDEKKLLNEGFDFYIAKPYDREDLIKLIQKAIR